MLACADALYEAGSGYSANGVEQSRPNERTAPHSRSMAATSCGSPVPSNWQAVLLPPRSAVLLPAVELVSQMNPAEGRLISLPTSHMTTAS